jgi:hypothetical protein
LWRRNESLLLPRLVASSPTNVMAPTYSGIRRVAANCEYHRPLSLTVR